MIAKPVVILGTLFLLLGCGALIEPVFRREGSLLRLVPVLLFNLPRPLRGGGDFPGYLTTLGVVVVYWIPAALLLVIGATVYWRRR